MEVGSAAQTHYLAETFTSAGIHFIAPDFSPVQDLDGNLIPMVEQRRTSLVWIYQNTREKFGGDPDRIYLSGFSSGGHLAACMVTTDWSAVPNAPIDIIKGALICSGMYDLVPVSLSYRSEYVNFTPETVDRLSAIRNIDQINCPFIIAYGSYETPEFKRQAIEFADALDKARVPNTLEVVAGYNHFETIETMGNPIGILGRVAIEQLHGIE
ncbi:alpha/beta hydrolase [Pelagicoccus sp. SDUM812002]|uniref:alpha/beta hydrolase n=1 Tax=Pelagicoccus sp. SDUM812002 TaxID=3041266 RepID=UPI00280ED934|nr:alpha/beta hydrolase [Pelagicoccus sp. SDUM812002]MDQ8186041.1 alpha/beta hydrolase [Pelagicoccus sp. SDUM812002]